MTVDKVRSLLALAPLLAKPSAALSTRSRLLFAGGRLGRSPTRAAWLDGLDDRRRDRRAKAGAGVPALARFEAAVVALHRVAEGALVPRRIERRIDEARRLAILPVGDGNQPGPKRGDGACASDHHVAAIDADDIARRGIGVAGDVGKATASGHQVGFRNIRAGLPDRQREDIADAATGRTTLRHFIPHGFLRDLRAAALQVGAATGQNVRAGAGKIDM